MGGLILLGCLIDHFQLTIGVLTEIILLYPQYPCALDCTLLGALHCWPRPKDVTTFRISPDSSTDPLVKRPRAHALRNALYQ